MSEFDFGNYAIVDEVEYHLEKEPEWFWTIKPPTSGDELQMSKFLVHNRVELDSSGIRREMPPTYTEIAYREISLCFGGTNIPKGGKKGKPVAEGGEPVLKTGAKIEQVENFLRLMPHAFVMEIWGAIADSIPGWGPQRPKVLNSQTQNDGDESP